MAPPVAVIVVASIAGSAAIAYTVKQTWEPYIKPELKKAEATVRTWWNARKRSVAPMGVNIGLRRSARRNGTRTPPRSRSPSPDGAVAPQATGSSLESMINDALQLPNEGGAHLRHRTNRQQQGSDTPNETVEMSELDKANPWMWQSPLSPVFSSTVPSNRESMVSNSTVTADPFNDANRTDTGVEHLDPYGFAPEASTSTAHQQQLHSGGLQLSFAGPSSYLSPPPTVHAPTPALGSPSSSRGVNANTSTATLGQSPLPSPMTQQTYERSSPRSAWTSSPASVFSWMDAAGGGSGTRSTTALSSTHADDFTHLHHMASDSEDAFSIGSYDDITGSSTHGDGDARTPVGYTTANDNDDEDDDDEPMSPPHNSEQGSPRQPRSGSSAASSSGWESVGSPSSDDGHADHTQTQTRGSIARLV